MEGWIASAEEVQLFSLDPDGDPDGPVVFRAAADSLLVAERDALLLERGLRLAPASAESLLQEMCRLWLQLCALMERRAQGDYGPDPLADTLPALEAAPVKPKAAVALKQLFEDYAASGASSPRTVAKWRPHVHSFVDYLGHDDATKVTAADVNGWVKKLIAKPLSVKTVQDSYPSRDQDHSWRCSGARPHPVESGPRRESARAKANPDAGQGTNRCRGRDDPESCLGAAA
ncbi:MAG: hypothetical protein ABS49_05630 [Erythrobacter sp. SCN 62-14]|nr:MAG: hypothetical protein ABS49_05630 [Erythrobacter sp. SCN 62-14]